MLYSDIVSILPGSILMLYTLQCYSTVLLVDWSIKVTFIRFPSSSFPKVKVIHVMNSDEINPRLVIDH